MTSTETRAYTIKGGDVHTSHQGQAVQFPKFANMDEARQACQSEPDVLEMFQSAYDVWLQGRVRGWAGANKDGSPKATLAEIQSKINDAKYARRVEGDGTKREAGPVKQLKNERAEQIAKLRELRATKPKQYENVKAAGFVPAAVLEEVEREETATA